MKKLLLFIFLVWSLLSYAQDTTGKHRPLIRFELGLLFQTPLNYEKQFVPGGRSSVDVSGYPVVYLNGFNNDYFESYESEYIFYKFHLRLYKGLSFSFRQAFTYDHLSFGIGEYYEPEFYENFVGYVHTTGYNFWVFQNAYALNYSFEWGNIPLNVYYQVTRRQTFAPDRDVVRRSIWFGMTEFFNYSFEGPGIEIYYKKLIFGAAFGFDSSQVNPIPTFLLFSLSFQLKEWY